MPEEPNWNLLPDNLLKFFQLQQGCNQRAFKRAYGKLLRQFKPERFPDEFKKIRNAYEQLKQQIEYGYWGDENETTPGYDNFTLDEGEKSNTADESEISSDDPVVFQHPVTAEIKVSVEPTWNERLETDSPEGLYTELVAKTPKEPEDYLKLAILSDTVSDQPDPGEPPLFETWLLRGIKQSPQNQVLIQALASYFAQLSETRFSGETQLIQFLFQLAKTINTHRFYGVTYPLWMNLIREVSPETFREALDRCEVILFDPDENEKLVFYIRIMNAMEWKIDEARRVANSHNLHKPELEELAGWLDSKKEYLEAHYDLIPYYNLDNIFDETNLIRLYHNNLGRFLNQDHTILRRRFHEMLREYILNTPEVAQEKLLQFQLSVLQDESEILDCFSSSLEDEQNFLNLWNWMVNDCPGMQMEPETERGKMKASAIQFLRQCHRIEFPEESEPRKKPLYGKLRKLILPIAFFLPLIGGFGHIWLNFVPIRTELEKNEFFLSIFLTLAAAVVCAFMGSFIQEPLVESDEPSRKEIDKEQQYRQYLQPIWIDFLASNHWQYESVTEIIKAEGTNWPYKNINLFLKFTTRDTGAIIVALARRSLP